MEKLFKYDPVPEAVAEPNEVSHLSKHDSEEGLKGTEIGHEDVDELARRFPGKWLLGAGTLFGFLVASVLYSATSSSPAAKAAQLPVLGGTGACKMYALRETGLVWDITGWDAQRKYVGLTQIDNLAVDGDKLYALRSTGDVYQLETSGWGSHPQKKNVGYLTQTEEIAAGSNKIYALRGGGDVYDITGSPRNLNIALTQIEKIAAGDNNKLYALRSGGDVYDISNGGVRNMRVPLTMIEDIGACGDKLYAIRSGGTIYDITGSNVQRKNVGLTMIESITK